MPPFDDYTSPPVTVATSNAGRNNSDFSSLSFPVVDHGSRSRATPTSLQVTRYSPNMRTPSPRHSPLKTATNSSKENSSRNLTEFDPQATLSSQNFQSPHKKQFYDDFEFDESSIFAEIESSSETQQRSNFERSPMRPHRSHGAGCVHSRQIVSRRCIHRNGNSIHSRNHQISSKSLPLKIQAQGANNSLVVNGNNSNGRPNSTRSQAVAISSKSQKSSVQSHNVSSSFVQPSTYTNCECFNNEKKEKSVRVPDNIPPPDQMFTVIQELNRQTYESKSELIFGELPSRTNQTIRHDDGELLLDDYERGITSFATRRVAMDANMKRADNFSGLNFSFCGSLSQTTNNR